MSTNLTDVQRPLALVTGASSGIGFELARKLAERGYDLMMVADNAEKLNEAADSLSGIDDLTQVEVVQADLSQREGVRKVYDSVRALHRPVDLLAANAGVGVYGGFSETDLEEEIALINLNVTSQVHLVKLISRDMIAHGGGDILITSSVAGVLPGPEFFERAHMEDTVVGESAKQDPAEVAETAIQALNEGADHIVPGVKNRMQVSAAKLMSDETKARIHGKQTERKH